MALYRIDDKAPQVAASAYIAAEATLIGAVSVGERATILAGAVARADNDPIVIGTESNVQEGAVLDADLIGIQAVVMNGAVIGRSSLVGAGAVVTEGKSFPERSLILGAPAKAVRTLTDADIANLERAASGYVERGAHFRTHLERVG